MTAEVPVINEMISNRKIKPDLNCCFYNGLVGKRTKGKSGQIMSINKLVIQRGGVYRATYASAEDRLHEVTCPTSRRSKDQVQNSH
ncbi:MAG: hypothetical protein ACJAVI_003059 [Candidatus Azotimanducaceae bacterium]|jgi:hypothetical protein